MDLRPTIQAWIVNPTMVTTQAYKQIVSIPNMGVVRQGIYKGSIWEQHFLEGSSLLKGSKAREVLFQVEFNPWIKWRNHYADIRSVEEVGGEEKIVFKSLIEGETGTVSYFDFETHLLNRLEMMINQLPSNFVYEDYREVNVVLIAHHVKIKRELFLEMRYEAFHFNVDYPKEVFALPTTITALIKASKLTKDEATPWNGHQRNVS